jgi:hypothetical protein
VFFARSFVFAGFVQSLVFEKAGNLAHVLSSGKVDVRPQLCGRSLRVRLVRAGIL